MDLMVEASPRRVFANAHTYHINSVSVNSDNETYLSADDLRLNLWHLEITDRSFSILECRRTQRLFSGLLNSFRFWVWVPNSPGEMKLHFMKCGIADTPI